jgi:predicted SAM-dependent methyltransferase
MLTQEKSIQVAGFSLMDEAESMLRSGHIQEGMNRLILGMNNIKQNHRELAAYPIQTIKNSVTALVRKKLTFENLDFVYAAGLYNYLSQPFTTCLSKIMFDMLRPGGRLLLANFVPDHLEVGYMETFM